MSAIHEAIKRAEEEVLQNKQVDNGAGHGDSI